MRRSVLPINEADDYYTIYDNGYGRRSSVDEERALHKTEEKLWKMSVCGRYVGFVWW